MHRSHSYLPTYFKSFVAKLPKLWVLASYRTTLNLVKDLYKGGIAGKKCYDRKMGKIGRWPLAEGRERDTEGEDQRGTHGPGIILEEG